MSNINETLDKMTETVDEIKDYAKEATQDKDPASKEKVEKLVNKAEKVITNAKEKVANAAASIKDDEQLNKFLNKVMIKVQEASDYTKMRISEIIPEQEKVEKFEKEIQETFDKFTETEGVQTVVSTFQKLTDQVSAYLAKPEVRAKINKAKKVTLNAAEKGMEQLRKLLEVNEDEIDDNIFEDDQD